jgi:2,3-bisphosphoglycerate-independent phosphoglycerate mutase
MSNQIQPDFYTRLIQPAQTKIVMVVLDGLGGLPREINGKTELETAHTPNLDTLAKLSDCGLTIPVAPGITPGSGPGHLALFGFDPQIHEIGRGAMEALGVDFELLPGDLAARGNFCTLDPGGLITDRRAGRLPTEQSQELIQSLASIHLPGAQVFIEPVLEHRFAWVLRADSLGEMLSDTDPQCTGVPPLPVRPLDSGSSKSAELVNQFIESAQRLLLTRHPANMILLRGFSRLPSLPSFQERYGLRAAAIAIHGMYRGVARTVGMHIIDLPAKTLEGEFSALEKNWEHFNFFYLHIKKLDTYGEMGDFDGKVRAIEEVDSLLPRLTRLKPDVLIITGDHSSPAVMKAHSWHPVPLLIYSRYARYEPVLKFCERECQHGSLGILPAAQVMPLALANALRLAKYGT